MIRGSKIGILTRTRRRVACRCGKAVGVRGWRREQLVNADDPNFQVQPSMYDTFFTFYSSSSLLTTTLPSPELASISPSPTFFIHHYNYLPSLDKGTLIN